MIGVDFDSKSCGQVTVEFEDGSHIFHVERVDDRWLVGVSDDFGDDEAETCESELSDE